MNFGDVNPGDCFRLPADGKIYIKDHTGAAFRRNEKGYRVYLDYVADSSHIETVKATQQPTTHQGASWTN